MATGRAVLSPPVPTSMDRSPRTESSAPSGVMDAKRSYWCCCPLRTRSAPAAYSRFHRFVTDSSDVHPGVLDEKKRGWWNAASVHFFGLAARSFWSHTSCADPTPPGTCVVFELSTMMCHATRSTVDSARSSVPQLAMLPATISTTPLSTPPPPPPPPLTLAVVVAG